MIDGVQTSDAERVRNDAAVLRQFGLRWAILGAWRDTLNLRSISVSSEVDLMLESARTKIASGCFSVCNVGCDLTQIEGALTAADASTNHSGVDFWVDLLGHAMSGRADVQADTERILKIPAVKARYNNCGLTECHC